MAQTRSFKELITEPTQNDPAFRKALLREAIEAMLNGDVATGKVVIRDLINATLGFAELERAVHIPAPSLMRMFSAKGNPSMKNLFGVLAHLQEREGIGFELRTRKV